MTEDLAATFRRAREVAFAEIEAERDAPRRKLLAEMADAELDQRNEEFNLAHVAHELGRADARNGYFEEDPVAPVIEAAVHHYRRKLKAEAEHARLNGRRRQAAETERAQHAEQVQRWTDHALEGLAPADRSMSDLAHPDDDTW